MRTKSILMTAEELLANPPAYGRSELVRGKLFVREPAGFRHGDVAARVLVAISNFIAGKQLGRVLAAETGFTLRRHPDTVRAPDVAFVRQARVPVPPARGFAELAPDLAVEVTSPSDRPGQVLAKVADWLTAGAQLVWVIDPERRLARVYRADGSESVYMAHDMLDGEDLLPGLHILVSDIVD